MLVYRRVYARRSPECRIYEKNPERVQVDMNIIASPHPLPRAEKLITHPLSAPAKPSILFDQSLVGTLP